MSELMNTRANGNDFHRRLLTTASAIALMASVYGGQAARASDDDADRPVLWIELGGQLDRLDGAQVPFAPPFFNAITKGGLESPLEAGRPAIYSNGAEGAISFMPDSSDWVFSGSVRYGRSEGHKFLHQQLKSQTTRFPLGGKYITARAPSNYAETKAANSEAHLVADFQAGKDVGLGMFGSASTSTISLGVRFAEFNAKSDVTIRALPDAHFRPLEFFGYQVLIPAYHQYFGSAQRASSFQGLGPSISWKASTPLSGNVHTGEIALDWGANAAVLFGRQKARMHHQSSGRYHYEKCLSAGCTVIIPLPPHTGTSDRNHSVVVPNIGGFAGVSFNFTNAKVSLGYRADFFFGAMDGGIDKARKENQGFYGPFATISVGLGG